jgi:hypothetical protein
VFPRARKKIRGEGEKFLRKSRTVSVLFYRTMTKRKVTSTDYAALNSGQAQKSVFRGSSGNPLNQPELPDSSTGTGKRAKLDQSKASILLTLVRDLPPALRFYNHSKGATKVYKESWPELLNMRKPTHFLLGQIGYSSSNNSSSSSSSLRYVTKTVFFLLGNRLP